MGQRTIRGPSGLPHFDMDLEVLVVSHCRGDHTYETDVVLKELHSMHSHGELTADEYKETVSVVLKNDVTRRMERLLEQGGHHKLQAAPWPPAAAGQRATTAALPERVSPPSAAEKLLYLLPKRYRDAMLGDMEEGFHERCRQFDPQYARRWYLWQVVFAILYGIARLLSVLPRWIGS